MTVKITFSIIDLAFAIKQAEIRQMQSIRQGLHDANNTRRTFLKQYTDEIIGVLGELAVLRHLKAPEIIKHNIYHNQADVLGNIDVRATARRDGRLIIREKDDDERIQILVIVTRYQAEIKGWKRVKECKQSQFLFNPNQDRPAFFVPQNALEPMEDLPW